MAEVVKGTLYQGLVSFVSYDRFFIFHVSDVCDVLFRCFSSSVAVQLIAWKDSSSEMTCYVPSGVLNPTHLHIYFTSILNVFYCYFYVMNCVLYNVHFISCFYCTICLYCSFYVVYVLPI